jgi:hypothetical protein
MKRLFFLTLTVGLSVFSCKKDEPIFTEQEATVVDLGAREVICEGTTVIDINKNWHVCVNLPDSLNNLRITYNKTFIISYKLLSSKGSCVSADFPDQKGRPIDRIELLTCRYK